MIPYDIIELVSKAYCHQHIKQITDCDLSSTRISNIPLKMISIWGLKKIFVQRNASKTIDWNILSISSLGLITNAPHGTSNVMRIRFMFWSITWLGVLQTPMETFVWQRNKSKIHLWCLSYHITVHFDWYRKWTRNGFLFRVVLIQWLRIEI